MYSLPRPVFSSEIEKIALREVKKQTLALLKPSKQMLLELEAICRAISTRKMPPHLLCKKLPDPFGHGIFLSPQAKPLRKGHVIGTYSGKLSLAAQNRPDTSAYAFGLLFGILLSKKEQHRFDPHHPFHPKRLYCLSVDAAKTGNFTRYINHSESPNVVAELCRIPSNSHGLFPAPIEVIYFAKKTIHPGEQLLVSYEGEDKSYWNTLDVKPLPLTPTTYTL
jgi:hypothetical protein